MPKSEIAGSYGGFIPSFLRKRHTIFHSGCINLHWHQQWKSVPLSYTSSPAFIIYRLFDDGSWESLGLQGDPASPFWRRSAVGFLWKEWCWSWNSSTLATSCEELTHWKRLWYWEGLGAGGEGDDRGWDGWMASLTQWTWVSVNSGSWWWTWRPGVLRFMGSQRVGHDWATDLIWCKWKWKLVTQSCPALRDPMDCSPPGSSVRGIL